MQVQKILNENPEMQGDFLQAEQGKNKTSSVAGTASWVTGSQMIKVCNRK